MSDLTLFAQVQEVPAVTELHLEVPLTAASLYAALAAKGLLAEPELAVFLDEDDKPLGRESKDVLKDVRNGARVHIVRCHRIKVAVHYQEKTAEEVFSPGTKVKKVKAWAVKSFKLTEKDAAEHVLQVCKSTTRPSADTPLQQLITNHECAVCFDLVPEKRVEG